MEKFWLKLHGLKIKLYMLYVRSRVNSVGKRAVVNPPITLYSPQQISIGDRTVIREHCWLNAARSEGSEPSLKIGSDCYIGRFGHINAARSVTIENKVLIADRVYISDYDHDFSDLATPVIDQGIRGKGPIVLREGCWIGIGSVILSGVTVGKNAVVGANSVVNRDVPDYAIVVGSPAKVVRDRRPDAR